eukprot:scaffold89081_cov69-Phaeocystis_antarctica.AAC.4
MAWVPAPMRPERLVGRRRTEARGSLEHDLVLKEAFREPAGRGLNHLAFHPNPGPDPNPDQVRCRPTGRRSGRAYHPGPTPTMTPSASRPSRAASQEGAALPQRPRKRTLMCT